MKLRFASRYAFEQAEGLREKIVGLEEGEEKKGAIMVASQLYYYAGEFGLKYLLGLAVETSREEVFEKFRVEGKVKLGDAFEEVLSFFVLLLPVKMGGKGFRNRGAYRGENGKIFLIHRNFAQAVLRLVS